MINISKASHDLFVKGYLIDPLNKGLSEEKKRCYLITSIALGIIAAAIVHIVLFARSLLTPSKAKHRIAQTDQEKEKAETAQNNKVMQLMQNNQLLLHGCRTYQANYKYDDLFGDDKWKRYTTFFDSDQIDKVNTERLTKRSHRKESAEQKYNLDLEKEDYVLHQRPASPTYKGTHKQSLTLVPPKGKIVPYVPFDWPQLNRVGLLIDANKSQFKKNKFIFQFDASVDISKIWKKIYTKEEIQDPNFETKRQEAAKEACEFAREKMHYLPFDELVKKNAESQGKFVPYNEVYASVHNKGIVGIFAFSRGKPMNMKGKLPYEDEKEKMDWPPLHHESRVKHRPNADYDKYMLLMGIGKKLATREKYGIDVPLYEINETTDTGLTLVPSKKQIELLKQVIENEQEQDRIVEVIKHVSYLKDSKRVKKGLVHTLKTYLKKL